jgi:hypothetical protein
LKGSSWIGDTVWLDENGDKIQQVDEFGLPGIRVNLYGVGADGIIGTGMILIKINDTRQFR